MCASPLSWRRLLPGVALLYTVVFFISQLSGVPMAIAAPLHALTVYGEAPKYPADFKHFDYVDPYAPKGGSLSRASEEIGQYNYLTPYVDQGISVSQIDAWVYAPLAYRSLDEPYTVYGLVAEKLERDPNNLWVRFYLNPNARFDDGTPITAQDVRYTYQTLITQGSFSYRPLYGDVKDVVIEAPGQIRFDFKNNLNRTLALDLASMRVLPEHSDTRSAIWAVYPAARHTDVKVRMLVDFLVERWAGELEVDAWPEPAWDGGPHRLLLLIFGGLTVLRESGGDKSAPWWRSMVAAVGRLAHFHPPEIDELRQAGFQP